MARVRLLPNGEYEIVNADGLGMKTDGDTIGIGSGTIDKSGTSSGGNSPPSDTMADASWSSRTNMPSGGRSDAGS